MDGILAIERNHEALKRILASLVAMAGLAGGAFPVLRACGGRPISLPRHLHRAVLRLLRPAESAARRLIIALARGITVTLPPQRPRKENSARRIRPTILRNGVGTGIIMPPGALAAAASARLPRAARPFALPLLDSLPRLDCRRPVASGVPRICVPGFTQPFPVAVRRPPSSDEPIDGTRLALRLAALASALDDLPREARRFARWRARGVDAVSAQNRGRDAAGARSRTPFDAAGAQRRKHRGLVRRIWPLRPGRPPGSRPPYGRRSVHEVDEVLAHAHALAMWALEHPDLGHDTS